ncbi:serine hydrolase domain-containing protein [Arsukibacterium indicum]|uniref:Beta-lactamase family protein n=1 Tax=Arsukibacterium indicum TaxID=2848612 RepID=A0ABS6MNX2_9GAMM|nr:serine hydrolase domain-containing protein [Arsukibacterium indicum]MBV2130486.1 beta-lactamase family protein [Arsukibacterium indicum]
MKRLYLTGLCLVLSACQNYDVATLTAIPPEVKQSIHSAVDNKHRPGVVIGLVNPTGSYFYSYGVTHANSETPLSEHTQFAIGSLTKLFTAALFDDLVSENRVSEQTTLAAIWQGIDDGAQTRLLNLVNHTAALPRDLSAETLAQNSTDRLLATLTRNAELPAAKAYSSVGMAILGLSLAAAEQSSFKGLLQSDILTPLKLTSTGFEPDNSLLAGRHHTTVPVESAIEVPEVAYGAGGLYSSAIDLSRFLKHQMQQTRHWGWQHYQDENFDAFYHGGDGNGHQAFIAFRPDNNVGVVLLSNSSSDDALQDIALHLIDPGRSLPDFAHRPRQQLPEQALSLYVGQYRLTEDNSGNQISLAIIDNRLVYRELTAAGEVVRQTPLHAIDDKTFELADVPVVITFETATGSSQATLRFENQTFTMKRINQDL